MRQKPVGGGSKAGGLPTLPFPSPPLSIPLSFQTNQWEGKSDAVRGKFPCFPPYKYHPGGFSISAAFLLCINARAKCVCNVCVLQESGWLAVNLIRLDAADKKMSLSSLIMLLSECFL